jgi:amino acid adenylation domain-containing protein/non-ribosomal peptide synthase protein (TIGR01720 family)
MYFHSLGDTGTGVDVEQIVCSIRGAFDEAAFITAFERVTSRHPILRTRLAPNAEGRPLQEVLGRVDVPVEELDLAHLDERERQARFEAELARDRERGLDLGHAPAMRLTIADLGEDECRVVWTFHHALLDGRSFPIVLREVFGVYNALLAGEQAELPAAPAYREHIERLRAIDLARAEEFWRERLAGFAAATPLVVDDRSNGEREGPVQGVTEMRLSRETTSELRAFAASLGVSLNTLLQTAWAVLLHRYSGESDIVFGATRAGRHGLTAPDTRVGLFINTLPVRVQLEPDATVADVLQQVRSWGLSLREVEHTPLARVQSWSDVPRGRPLFETLVVYDNQSLGETLKDLRAQGAVIEFSYRGQTNYPLTLIGYGDEELLLRLENDRRHVGDAATIRMLRHVATLLVAMPSHRDRMPHELPLLSEEEWPSTQAESVSFPRDRCLHERFAEQAEATPERIAASCDDRELTYAELNRRSNAIAWKLYDLGVRPRQLVGLRVERSLDVVVGILAILKAGAAYVPLDPAYPKDRVQFMLQDADVHAVLTTTDLARDLDPASTSPILLDEQHGEAEDGPSAEIGPDDLAYVMYTSGSTGQPKGVRVSHYNVTRLFDATAPWFGFTEHDTWTLFHSYAFDFSVWEIWGALLNGGRLVVVPYWTSRSPIDFRELVVREGVTVLNQTPSAFRQLVQADRDAEDARPYALRYVVFGGEALELQSLRPWFDRHGDTEPRLVNMYGITETTVHVTYRPLAREDLESGAGSVIGIPIPDLEVVLLDPHGAPVPVGVPGEMYIGGAGVTQGYLERPELTAERFLPDPRPGRTRSRLYRSGDLARRLENGDLEYLGRIDDQVKIRGFRIELGEIEAVLSEQDDVGECAVMAREDGSAEKQLVAYVVGAALDADDLRRRLQLKLPEYMVPAHFVVLPALPLTTNGKVDRKALPAPEIVRTDLSTPYAPPRTPAESTLAEIWGSVLGLEKVGLDDNIVELGGDSILSIQVVTRCRAAGLEISPRNLFETPTISGLARKAALATAGPTEEGPPSGPVPLTPIQQWFFEQGLGAATHWNQSFVLEVPPGIDVDLLEEALGHVVSHHDALRLRFWQTGEEWFQEYAEAPSRSGIVRVDLASVPAPSRSEALTARATTLQAQVDIAGGPLLRALHADFGPDESGRLVLAIHHLAVDGVSWRILLEDLESAYVSLREGREVTLPPRTTSYQRWAHALTAHAMDAAVRDTLPWWRSLAADHPLPTDRSGENLEATARTHVVRLSGSETQAVLRRLPAVYGTEVNDALLTALAHALSRWTSRSSLVVELEGHGREDVFDGIDLSRTVGWFTSIFPFRVDAASAGPFTTLLETKERRVATPQRGLGYGVLRYLGDDEARATLGALPQPDVLLNYLGQFDQVVEGSSLFAFAPDSAGPWHDPSMPRRHALEVLVVVRNGALEARFVYSDALHEDETIERVGNEFVDVLRELVAGAEAATGRRFTPSDFPLAKLDDAAVDRLVAAYPLLEEAYPLSPMQGLFYAMQETDSGIGLEDWRFAIRGSLDPDLLRHAWEHVVARHSVLRTAFAEGVSESPLQVVLREVEPPWREEDLRQSSGEERDARLAEIVEHERALGFDLGSAPLLRFVLVRLEDERWDLLWFTHHLYVDGWSWPVIFHDLGEAYRALARGDTPGDAHAIRYSSYIEWLESRAETDAETFWKAELAGFTEPTPIDLDLAHLDRAAGEHVALLSTAETELLRTVARRRQVTLSSVVQTAWALVLAHYSNSRDVVFGAAFSGRPTELPGVEGLVGPCVNNVAVRARLATSSTLAEAAAHLQSKQVSLIARQHDPVADVHRWAGIPLRQRLFDSLVVFQNYADGDADLSLSDAAELELLVGPDATNYLVTLVVVPQNELRLELLCLAGRISPAQGDAMIDDLRTLVAAFAHEPDAALDEILARLPTERSGRAAVVAREHRQPAAAYVAPAGEMEEVVAKIWRELFEVDRIGMDDNFFDLGGHSLLLVRAHQRLVDEVRPDLPVSALFQYPTARSLARHLSGASDAGPARGARDRAGRQREALARLKTARGRS